LRCPLGTASLDRVDTLLGQPASVASEIARFGQCHVGDRAQTHLARATGQHEAEDP
jgi:hypothetical protein